MADLIDRAALVEQFRKKQIFEVFPEWEELENSTKIAIIRLQRKFREVILSAPTVDAVEVVRCKDCKHYVPVASAFFDDVMCCTRQGSMNILKTEHDYCSWGERKNDAAD